MLETVTNLFFAVSFTYYVFLTTLFIIPLRAALWDSVLRDDDFKNMSGDTKTSVVKIAVTLYTITGSMIGGLLLYGFMSDSTSIACLIVTTALCVVLSSIVDFNEVLKG